MLDGDTRLAEDAAQQAWVKVWRGLADFRGSSQVRTWVFTIVQRETVTLRRRKRPLAVDDQILEPLANRASAATRQARSTVDPEQAALSRELWETLSLALGELPWTQRAAWLLREQEDLSYAEIARVLGVSPTVVRGQLHRARRTLAIRMEQWR